MLDTSECWIAERLDQETRQFLPLRQMQYLACGKIPTAQNRNCDRVYCGRATFSHTVQYESPRPQTRVRRPGLTASPQIAVQSSDSIDDSVTKWNIVVLAAP